MQILTLKKLVIGTGLVSVAIIAWADADPYAMHMEENRKVAQEFMQKLAGTLKQHIESAGTESAINVCKEVAPALEKQYSTDGKLVKRVSLKPRNQSLGTPNAEERVALENFDKQQHAGGPATLELATVYQDASGEEWFHYMRAIPTQPQCLQCHGKTEDIAENVKALLAKEYPEDKATGYSVGEIRGAVSIRQKIN
ncbi:MAG: hypothetical protein CVU35_06135 [Betaproteobacteria bacterium HGW-Betaproteobacteria-8]|nr:MAG: hypothetical protein CVU35_06135 [Betaproteobacteria bacterium HGW-Betaproteobacteria-8]